MQSYLDAQTGTIPRLVGPIFKTRLTEMSEASMQKHHCQKCDAIASITENHNTPGQRNSALTELHEPAYNESNEGAKLKLNKNRRLSI